MNKKLCISASAQTAPFNLRRGAFVTLLLIFALSLWGAVNMRAASPGTDAGAGANVSADTSADANANDAPVINGDSSVPLSPPTPRYADMYDVPLQARTAVLIEESTGKVLYSKDENVRVYPASITKVLTALIALEYLELDELVTVGDEIGEEYIPGDSSQAGNKVGEVMTVRNMIRLIIIPSGNETSNVAARAVARIVSGNPDIPYAEAERIFAGLMNDKARELGANNSFFINPHGYHHADHYTTAYDMALICRAAMQNDFIRQVVSEVIFSGTGAPQLPDGSRYLIEHQFETRNYLLIPDSIYFYPYATGMKTGYTSDAGECLAASATKDGKNLIALVFGLPENERWHDAVNLLEFGFNTFDFETIHNPGEKIDSIPITNHKLGEEEYLDIYTTGYFQDFVTKNDLANIKREVIYFENFITPDDEKDEKEEEIFSLMQFKAPIAEGETVGKMVYTLYDNVIFECGLVAARTVDERTSESDREYYKEVVKANIFTVNALPYWFGLLLIIFLIVQAVLFFNRRRRSKRFRRRSRFF